MNIPAVVWSRRLGFYLFWAMVFLLWENLVNSLLGVYHLEIRRTLWALVYYSLFFLLLGGLTEIVDFLYRHLRPRFTWPGQKHVWLITLLLTLLWGDFYRRLAIRAFAANSFGMDYPIIISWLLLIFSAALIANVILAKRHSRRPFSPVQISMVAFSGFLYLIISTKISYFYFQERLFSAWTLSFWVVSLGIIIGLSWVLQRWKTFPRNAPRWLVPVAIVLTLFVLLLSPVLRSKGEAESVQFSRSRTEQPNIVILLFDALRADQVGPSNSNRSHTPTIDRLAATGQSYPRCYAVSSWTLPAVTALLTGRLPHELYSNGDLYRGLPRDLPTLTTVLHDHGYYTAGVSANEMISANYGFARSFQDFQYLQPRGSNQLLLPLRSFFPLIPGSEELAYQLGFCTTDWAFAPWSQISRQAVKLMARQADKPFFFYLHYLEPHSPYWAKPFHEGWLDLQQIKLSPYLMNRPAARSPAAQTFLQKHETEWKSTLFQRYQEGVEVADAAVEDLRRNLRRLGLADNTILIVTADHGEEFMEHGHWGHRNSLFEETVRIPLVIYIPEALHLALPEPPTNVSQVDIAPTILDLVGAEADLPHGDGQSLMEASAVGERPAFLELDLPKKSWRGVVLDHLKLVVADNQATGKWDTLFFDLAKDPQERNNLYPCHSASLDSLCILLQSQFNQPNHKSSQEPVHFTPEERERLRALGYIE